MTTVQATIVTPIKPNPMKNPIPNLTAMAFTAMAIIVSKEIQVIA